MRFYADLHVHSKYSRATSRDCDLEHMAWWARRKGIGVVATGDFTHPAWWAEIGEKLTPAEPGLFRLRPELEREVERRLPPSCRGEPTRFLLEVEISTIYKKGEKTRKIHHLIYAPDLESAGRVRDRLGGIGNIASDGRPILGLDSRHLLEITLESGPGCYLIPAHIWTPWFAVLGSKGGFDTIEECYGDLSEHIFALETGLSSDPPMNWRLSRLDRYTLVSNSDAHSPPKLGREACLFDTELDYFAIRRALETGRGYGGTVEFFPEEGKYHLDGHRSCGVCLEPEETRRHEGRCPACGKALTVGVMHRVEDLADRAEPAPPPGAAPFRSLVPLPEIVGEIRGVGAGSKTVRRDVDALVDRHGPELQLLDEVPLEDLRRGGDPMVVEALRRLRAGEVRRKSGYDGEYGVIHLFAPEEIAPKPLAAPLLFELPEPEPERAGEEPSPSADQTDGPPPALRARPEAAGHAPRAEEAPPAADATLSPTLATLDPEQRAAASVAAGPLLIVAGPGTGKTRTLTHRLAHLITDLGVDPASCLAVTFTRRAAEELAERLAELVPGSTAGVRVQTFHGLGLEILREQTEPCGLPLDFRVADPETCRKRLRELFAASEREAGRLLAELGRLRRDGGDAAEDPHLALYRRSLRESGLVDFDDLLSLPEGLLDARPDLAASYRERFPHLSIDEYQDIDPLQYRLVRHLASPAGSLCAIGDPDQSIYSFRGSDVGFFLRFEEDFPGARHFVLERSYRSSAAIVRGATQAIAPESLVPGRILRAMAEGEGAPIEIQECASEAAEAEHVVHRIERLLGGTSYFSVDSGRVDSGAVDSGDSGELSFDDFAVLYRTAAQSESLATALDRAGIPYQRRGHERLLERAEARALAELLEADEGREGDALDRLRSLVEAASEEERAELAAGLDLLAPLAREHPEPAGFLAALALGAEVDTWDPRAERVSLLTLHAAKGLEFPVVFIVGCEDGLLPLRFGGREPNPEALTEERRLFFVGMTRAERRLVLTYARKRRYHGQLHERAPSPFLAELQDTLHGRRESRPKPKQRKPRQLSLL